MIFIFFIFISITFAVQCNEGIKCDLQLTKKLMNVTGNGAWTSMTNVERNTVNLLIIGPGITSIEVTSLNQLSSLKTVRCEEGSTLIKIGKNVFSKTSQIEIIECSTIEIIEESAFEFTMTSLKSKLTSFNFGKIKSIKENAFKNTQLRTVSLPKSLEYLASTAFENCPRIICC